MLCLNEEQTLLQTAAAELFAAKGGLNVLRHLRDKEDSRGYDTKLWQEMIQLGWSAMTIPEEYDGIDFGFAGLGVILIESGRYLSQSPLLMTVGVAVPVLCHTTNKEIKSTWLAKIASGDSLFALAVDEHAVHNAEVTQTIASSKAAQWFLSGKKYFVIDGGFADAYIVSAVIKDAKTSSSDLALFLVEANATDCKTDQLSTINYRSAVNLSFDHTPASLLCRGSEARTVLDFALDCGRTAVAAEMLGAAEESLNSTVSYLKEREQFGVKIASFQALQHRAAMAFTELQLTRSTVLDALSKIERAWNLDKKDEILTAALAASHAKTSANNCFKHVVSEAMQMHGGIAMTDEFDLGFYLKHMQVATNIFGANHFLKKRYATLSGF